MRDLTDSERTALQALVGRMIPASAKYGVPGADDDAIFAEILKALSTVPGMLDAVLGQIAAPDAEPPPALTPVVLQCYYRDDRVMRALGMDARPPFPKGFTVEEGDFSLLDPVRARPAIWRKA